MSAAQNVQTSPELIKMHHGALVIVRAKSTSDSVLLKLTKKDELKSFVTTLNSAAAKFKGKPGAEIVLAGGTYWLKEIERSLSLGPNFKIIMAEREGEFSAFYFSDGGRLRIEKAPESKTRKRRVMIVDDSVTIRKLLRQIFSQDPELEVVAEAGLPSEVEGLIKAHKPDVITLDIGLPEMNGVELLQKYLPVHSIPTVMISALSQSESPLVLQSLESGAVDYIQKPVHEQLKELAPVIIEKVKTASHARVRRPRIRASNTFTGKLRDDVLLAIGASTGGTEAIYDVLATLPKDIPPIVITQHIPPVFSAAFAKRLNDLCQFEVREAKDGDICLPGLALIAPGGRQMGVEKHGNGWRVFVNDDPPVNRHRPSVDYLFDTVAKVAGQRALGVILTGMGADGAKGLARMRAAGAFTIGQDEASCVVYGMPRAAMKENAVMEQLSLEKIGPRLIDKLK